VRLSSRHVELVLVLLVGPEERNRVEILKQLNKQLSGELSVQCLNQGAVSFFVMLNLETNNLHLRVWIELLEVESVKSVESHTF